MSEPTPRKKTKSAIVGSDPISQLYRASHTALLRCLKIYQNEIEYDHLVRISWSDAEVNDGRAAIAAAEEIEKHV